MRSIDCLNVAKICTFLCIAYAANVWGLTTARQCLYFALHSSYLTWWFLHQVLSPNFAEKVLGQQQSIVGLVLITLIFGIGYAYPCYFAFRPQSPAASPLEITLSIFLFCIGSFVNISADMYKDGAKSESNSRPNIYTGPLRLSQHLNWFGDWLRYTSFAVASGHWASYFLPLFVVAFNILMAQDRTQKSKANQANGKPAADALKSKMMPPQYLPTHAGVWVCVSAVPLAAVLLTQAWSPLA